MRADGSVAEPLDEAQLLRQVDVLRAAGVTSVALVFLHAYANPAHEEQAARAIAAHAPELFVTPSHAVVREIREYERASTTVASAYVVNRRRRVTPSIMRVSRWTQRINSFFAGVPIGADRDPTQQDVFPFASNTCDQN